MFFSEVSNKKDKLTLFTRGPADDFKTRLEDDLGGLFMPNLKTQTGEELAGWIFPLTEEKNIEQFLEEYETADICSETSYVNEDILEMLQEIFDRLEALEKQVFGKNVSNKE